jgi:hypothetical protein
MSRGLALTLLLLALATPALAGPRCLTYEEKTLDRLQTLCDDGPRFGSVCIYWAQQPCIPCSRQ